ncbi:MAG TPA: glutamate--tRNA ligase [Acidimicrobiales bacterium]|nr:glutamate--tRNA ligase [Acidimicrobiales bacterium]
MSGPRVRIAPSPTGFFHVGTARTALFNWLFSHQSHGTFILRIEDTDTERNIEEAREGIITAMHWLDLNFDEGPFLQSDLLSDHVEAAEALYANGYLYACDCTREEIDVRIKTNDKPGYDGYCRDRNVPRTDSTALRFRVPEEGVTVVHDVIRGDVTFAHDSYEDFIVVRSNGVVLYPLANAVDDRCMGITHVIRGEDLLPTAPKQVMMWEALNLCEGIEPVALPLYAHLPMLVNEQRKKLSKRKDPVAVESYHDQGYLPTAFVNYLALLGWSPRGEEEIVPRATLVEQFRLEDVSHSPAFFDVKKLTHMNGEYIRALSLDEFVEAATPWVAPWLSEWRPSDRQVPWTHLQFDAELFHRVAHLVQERVATLGEIPSMVSFFFLDEVPYDDAAFDKTIANDDVGRKVLGLAIDAFATVEWNTVALHESTLQLGESLGLALRKSQAPIRCAITGTLVGPPLFESMELLGREAVLKRLRGALVRADG